MELNDKMHAWQASTRLEQAAKRNNLTTGQPYTNQTHKEGNPMVRIFALTLARRLIYLLACVVLIALGLLSSASAQTKPTPANTNLNLVVNDPLASYRQLQLRTNFNTSRWQTDSETTDWEFRAIFPYRAWNRPNILRIITPFTSEPPGSSALKDIEIADLAVFDYCWGQSGFGLAASIATNEIDENKDDFSLGPAAAFVVQPNDRFQWGLFNKNFLTGRPTLSTLQPILTYALGNGWDVGSSSMIYTYDWHNGELISAPVGFSVGKIFNAGSQPMRVFMESEYNFKDIPGASKFRVLIGLSLLAGP